MKEANFIKKIRKRKINKKNVILLMLLLICTALVIHDLYFILIQPIINGQSAGWTYFGFITFILAIFLGGNIIDYFIDEFKK